MHDEEDFGRVILYYIHHTSLTIVRSIFYRYEDEMFSRLEPQSQGHSLSEYGKRFSTGYAPPGRGYALIRTPERASAEAWVKGVC